ncbi:MAG: gas vesicle protein K, partial [candidate division Zixibacteria bacterium]|nr:gas vesicle protein K [candidate division Zixibacteria bacterium]
MPKTKIATKNLLIDQQRVTLLELLDRLLDKGVVAKGEIILSVADIDLVYLNLGLLLSSVKTVEKARGIGGGSSGFFTREEGDEDFFKEENPNIKWVEEVKTPRGWQAEQGETMPALSEAEGTPSMVEEAVKPSNGERTKIIPRTNIDPNNVEKGLTKLVLTLIELLRKLMEKQAIRRMEAGFLTASEV